MADLGGADRGQQEQEQQEEEVCEGLTTTTLPHLGPQLGCSGLSNYKSLYAYSLDLAHLKQHLDDEALQHQEMEALCDKSTFLCCTHKHEVAKLLQQIQGSGAQVAVEMCNSCGTSSESGPPWFF